MPLAFSSLYYWDLLTSPLATSGDVIATWLEILCLSVYPLFLPGMMACLLSNAKLPRKFRIQTLKRRWELLLLISIGIFNVVLSFVNITDGQLAISVTDAFGDLLFIWIIINSGKLISLKCWVVYCSFCFHLR